MRAVRPDVFDTLIRLGADPTLPDDGGNVPDPTNCGRWNTPVFFRLAGADVVADCIRRGADVTGAGDGATPLHHASTFTRDPAVISTMVRGGADVNARDDQRHTPLHLAARHNTDPAIVSALLEAGAEVESRARDGRRFTAPSRRTAARTSLSRCWSPGRM
ncbi:MAG: ankyrin repeat domain-containing protein [Gemmatimonadota bacterium]|nr:ankyrin repeat domain-containing protein [Gemmatimonadota bacterium]MDE2871948.1 ankyrin repeat domain-containing protein [Gemmatimonadota bacterium]